MQIGDRVYDKKINANGYILDINRADNKYQVQYFWGMHSKFAMGWPERSRSKWHTETPDKRRWAEEYDLILTPMPLQKRNTVGIYGTRILNVRFRLIAELPQYNYGDRFDIVMRYGVRPDSYRMRPEPKLVLNHNLTINKWEQCQKLGDLVPQTASEPFDEMGEGWIVKPFNSVGGKMIEDWNGANHYGRYLQKRLDKAREFRVHCYLWAKDPVPLIQEKIMDDTSQLCWNMKKGGRFHYPYEPAIGRNSSEALKQDLVDRLTNLSIKALKRLKYDMGGIDFALDTNGKLWIMEVNSYWGQREMTLAASKSIFWELYNLDIDDYKENRWKEEEVIRLSDLEDVVTDEEREAMLEAGRAVETPLLTWDGDMSASQLPEPDPQLLEADIAEMEHRAAAAIILEEDYKKTLREEQFGPDPESEEDDIVAILGSFDIVDESDEYEAALAKIANRIAFCPACGSNIPDNVFGIKPKYCTVCGQQVR